MTGDLTHLDEQGRARMVDITGKPVTLRRALARCRVVGVADALAGDGEDPMGTARLAGIMGGKLTSDLVPLCHPLPLTEIDVSVALDGDDVAVEATAETVSRTGVEMEALTACALAALSVVRHVIAERPEARIDELTLWTKTGGRSGGWRRVAAGPAGMRPADGSGPREPANAPARTPR